jgi:phosphoribosylaminoimidazole-succinocarboxamide synthase
MHGMELPKGMKESTQFIPPLFTPSTKAELGDKDENIHPDRRKSFPSSSTPSASPAAPGCIFERVA